MNDLSRLKVCFLAGTLERGGAERQLFYILQALQAAGANARLLCLERGGFWEEPIRKLGIPIHWVGQRSGRLPRLWRIVRELRRNPPAILQSQHFYTNAYVAAAARLLGASDVGAMRSNGQMEVRDSGPVGWLNLFSPRTLAANSRAAIRFALGCRVPPHRLYFLPNVVDTSQFSPASDDDARPLCLVAVGRLVPAKRFDRFISALAQVRRQAKVQVRARIVGAGPLQSQLESQAAALGLGPEALEFTGAMANLPALYRQADICVLTSDREGTPNALLEAMACGLPVVATRVGGVPEVVRPGLNGFIVEPNDVDGLAAALLELAHQPALRIQMGRQARTYVEDYHSLERLPKQLQGLFRLALPPARSPGRDQAGPVPARPDLAHAA